MKIRTFNYIASSIAFIVGAVFVFADGAGITANVIGASGSSAGLVSIIGVVMIISSIGLFIVSQTSTDNHPLDLERLIRGTRNHTNLTKDEYPEEEKNMHTVKKD